MKIINYNFHNLLRVKIILNKNTPFSRYLEQTFHYYQVDEIPNSDLTFFIGNFEAKIDGCKPKDDFLIKENYVYHRFKHKINMMEMEIDGLEDTETIVRVSSGWLNTLRSVGHVLFPLIKFKFTYKGYPALFSSSVARETKAVLLSAKGRTGKTSMVLWAIKHGFGFLGDGTIVLSENKVFNFITPLNLFANHFPIVKDSLSFKTRFILLCNKLSYLILGEKHKMFARININAISSDCVINESVPAHVCLSERYGDKFAIECNVDNTEAIKEMISIHKSTAKLMTRMLAAYTSVFTNSKLADYWTNLESDLHRCLKYAKFHRITYPENYSINLVNEVFDKVLGEIPIN